MKNLIFFLLTLVFLVSCGGEGKEPTDYITFGQAFSHVSKSFSYWLFNILALGIGGYVISRLLKNYKKQQDWTATNSVILFVVVAVIFTTFLMRPCEVAANTTVEQALRGVYIGY